MTSKDAGIRRSTAKLALFALTAEPRDMVHAKAMMLVARRQLQVLVNDLTADFLVAAQSELASGLTALDAAAEADVALMVTHAAPEDPADQIDPAPPAPAEPDVGFDVPQDRPIELIDRAA